MFVLLAVAAACHVAPARAVFKTEGYICHEQSDLTGLGNNVLGGSLAVKDLKACFEWCNKVDGCIAVQWTAQSTATNNWTLCNILGSVKKMTPNNPRHFHYTTMHACLKVKKYSGPPQNYTPIPQPPEIYRQDQLRPGPQPGPAPGGRP